MGQVEYEQVTGANPILPLDYPDVDVIRVGDTYYMVSTTMHFMPGGVLLRSYDLIHWEIATYIYDALEDTTGQMLTDGKGIYGQGMWAASLRYHKGTYYVCFVANDTGKTYLYTATDIGGPWHKTNIEGFYHDCSLLFDDDDRVYIAYGNRQMWLTELRSDLTGPKEGGLHRMLLEDKNDVRLGYEGAHLYKIGGYYYIFLIHWYKDGSQPCVGRTAEKTASVGATEARADNIGIRTEACFYSDSLTGEFVGGDVLADDMGYHHQGAAQGGVVDTPEGDWYAMLFMDHGAVGRIPVLVPVHLTPGQMPVFGVNGTVPKEPVSRSTRPGYAYAPLYGSEDYADGKLASFWQWNHIPELGLVKIEECHLAITTGALATESVYTRNMLTQRMVLPVSEFTVTVDASELNDGDYCGICALQYEYANLAVMKEQGAYALVLQEKLLLPEVPEHCVLWEKRPDGQYACLVETERVALNGALVTLQVRGDYRDMRDEVTFAYREVCEADDAGKEIAQGSEMPLRPIGAVHKVHFRLEHFCGVRFGMYVQSTKVTGGTGRFGRVDVKVLTV